MEDRSLRITEQTSCLQGIYFLCLPGNEEFAMTVREGVDTLQDIFEQRNY